MAAQYSVEFNIAVEILANPGNPAAYDAEPITDPALADLQSRMVSVRATREFDDTHASKMGGPRAGVPHRRHGDPVDRVPLEGLDFTPSATPSLTWERSDEIEAVVIGMSEAGSGRPSFSSASASSCRAGAR